MRNPVLNTLSKVAFAFAVVMVLYQVAVSYSLADYGYSGQKFLETLESAAGTTFVFFLLSLLLFILAEVFPEKKGSKAE